jgi:SAM-dependent methyltransferase
MNAAAFFDQLAPDYDDLWTSAPAGQLQREAFWTCAGPFLRDAARVLDIGCGTGEDAVRLLASGVDVTAVDVSSRMVAIARSRGVNASVLAAEDLSRTGERFDCVLSNFGALNCVANLGALRKPLSDAVRPGGYAILCVFGGFCAWETIWSLLHGRPWMAVRRLGGKAGTRNGLSVYYPRVREIRGALSPDFELVARFGIGIAVPPSFAPRLPHRMLALAARIDRRLCSLPGFRAIADHALLIFKRSNG